MLLLSLVLVPMGPCHHQVLERVVLVLVLVQLHARGLVGQFRRVVGSRLKPDVHVEQGQVGRPHRGALATPHSMGAANFLREAASRQVL